MSSAIPGSSVIRAGRSGFSLHWQSVQQAIELRSPRSPMLTLIML
jgi:hypothetical protein